MTNVTYLRFAFAGDARRGIAGRALDDGILRALWLTPDEIRRRASRHRSPLVMRCVDDYLPASASARLLYTHPSALSARGRSGARSR
jgi:hypothetical protein